MTGEAVANAEFLFEVGYHGSTEEVAGMVTEWGLTRDVEGVLASAGTGDADTRYGNTSCATMSSTSNATPTVNH